MYSSSPLSAFIDETNSNQFSPKKQALKKKKALFAGLLLLIPSLSTTLAGQITLGTGAIEFGQGSQTTAVCDTNITVSLASTYSSANSFFRVSTVTLGDLDTTSSGCQNRTLTIKALNSSGTELDLNGSSAGTALTHTPTASPGSTSATVTLTLDSGVNVNSTAVAQVLLETSS